MRSAGLLCALTVLLTATSARAAADDSNEAFERAGRNALVIDGLAGFGSFHVNYPGSTIRPRSLQQVGVVGQVPFTRLGYHRFLTSFGAHGISLGLGAQWIASDASLIFGNDTVVWSAAPRIGWSSAITRRASFWLRVGPGILYGSRSNTSFGQISLGGEAMLVLRPTPDFGLTLMTFLESGIAGREVVEINDTSRAIRFRTIGFTLGALVAF